jgi:hypothetical protein
MTYATSPNQLLNSAQVKHNKPLTHKYNAPYSLNKSVARLNTPTQADFDWQSLVPAKNLLRVQEVAHMLSCSVDHVYNLLDEGALKVAVDIRTQGARRSCPRVLRASVLEFLQRNDLAKKCA